MSSNLKLVRLVAGGFLLLSMLVLASLPAEAIVASDRGPITRTRRDLDIRDDSKQGTARYVVFCSREAIVLPVSPGHAFVILGFEDPERGLCGQEGWGYYPTDDAAKSVFREVPGKILDEYLHGIAAADVLLSLRVSDKQYGAVTAILDTWKKKDLYKLREQDCVTFVGEVAASLSLGVPDRGTWSTKLPATFVFDLAGLNTEATLFTGVWEYSDAPNHVRFRLEIEGKLCTWIDNPPEGTQIRHSTELSGKGPMFDLKRDNTPDVLEKLGYRDSSTRQQIVDRHPGPSILSIMRNGRDLQGQWKGLFITKQKNNVDVKEIKFSDKAVTFQRILK